MRILNKVYRKLPDRVKLMIINVHDYWYIKYQFLLKHKPLINEIHNSLERVGVKKIKPYEKKIWKISPVFSQYYTGVLNGKKVFCKVCVKDAFGVVEREFNVLKKIEEESYALSNHIPKAFKFIENDDYDIIISEFIVGDTIFNTSLSIKEMCQQMLKILVELERLKLVHMDIRPSNFIVKHNQLYLIDFGLAFDCSQTDDCIYSCMTMPYVLRGVGCGKYNPEDYEYDDAYAILRTMKDVCPNLKKDYKDYWFEFNMHIGTRTVKLKEENIRKQ